MWTTTGKNNLADQISVSFMFYWSQCQTIQLHSNRDRNESPPERNLLGRKKPELQVRWRSEKNKPAFFMLFFFCKIPRLPKINPTDTLRGPSTFLKGGTPSRLLVFQRQTAAVQINSWLSDGECCWWWSASPESTAKREGTRQRGWGWVHSYVIRSGCIELSLKGLAPSSSVTLCAPPRPPPSKSCPLCCSNLSVAHFRSAKLAKG